MKEKITQITEYNPENNTGQSLLPIRVLKG